MSDYVSEAEALAEIYDDYNSYSIKSYGTYYRPRKRKIKVKKKFNSNKYFIVQDSRFEDSVLLLVDRSKTKKYFWTKDITLALKIDEKQIESFLTKFKYNNVRAVKTSEIY